MSSPASASNSARSLANRSTSRCSSAKCSRLSAASCWQSAVLPLSWASWFVRRSSRLSFPASRLLSSSLNSRPS
ncbi:hypothetical protein CgunFtcFv8_017207 [Champsocephalus gunnari]|uniref:Uncharacterized protein n=1 Tax=Champsocephalus gunnari TaxID=52237 RepID=A0AAN8HQX6_CHAGU|nr:hypothetical protein CgunFtcFv8_017207 [Champsocephalus gunnari]